MFTLGLVINPYAGIGGALALKGSDGAETRAKALALGAEQKALARTLTALDVLKPYRSQVTVLTANGDMGESVAKDAGFEVTVVYDCGQTQSEGADTEATIAAFMQHQVDVILFAGGDGTARNVCTIAAASVPVIGIPAGCKIHSGVYAVTPQAAGRVVEQMIKGEIVSVNSADVMDIDEDAFRAGKVQARRYGEMQVPASLQYVQAVKRGGKESEELVVMDIAAHVIEEMDDDIHVMGSGSTVAAIMQELALENTLLGVDIIQDARLCASDVTATQLLTFLQQQKQQHPETAVKLVITLIGGQGHVFGRGNQQLSPEVIRFIGKDNIVLVATKTKLNQLNGRPLIADTGDQALDKSLAGWIKVVTGYRDQVLYRIGLEE